jgi:hypothetical protein
MRTIKKTFAESGRSIVSAIFLAVILCGSIFAVVNVIVTFLVASFHLVQSGFLKL